MAIMRQRLARKLDAFDVHGPHGRQRHSIENDALGPGLRVQRIHLGHVEALLTLADDGLRALLRR